MPCRLKSGALIWNPVSNVGQGLGSVLELTLILCLIYIVDLVAEHFILVHRKLSLPFGFGNFEGVFT